MNNVKIRKSGTFYSVFDDDCYILYFLFGYKISNNKTGFPKSALNKVINKLDENKINYEVVGDTLKNNFKNLNKYQKFVKVGKEKYNNDINYQNIINKLSHANSSKLDKLLSTIEMILDQ